MNEFSMLQSSLQGRIKSRSMGVKLIVVCGLALLMTIPALFVSGLVDDRTKRAEDVVKEISNHVVGVAQIIFYLLLLSLAERIGFDYGFLLAGFATVVPAFGQCRMDILQPTPGHEGTYHLYAAVHAELSVTETRRQRAAGRRNGQFYGSGSCNVLHSQNRLAALFRQQALPDRHHR
jgi:hypothetical protein